MQIRHETVAARTEEPPPRHSTTPIPHANAETGTLQGHQFWRTLTQHLDTVIKANCTAQVIPSAQVVAEEVLRQQQQQHLAEHGTRVSRERWMDRHTVLECVEGGGQTNEVRV